jgi:hypothetical protein
MQIIVLNIVSNLRLGQFDAIEKLSLAIAMSQNFNYTQLLSISSENLSDFHVN